MANASDNPQLVAGQYDLVRYAPRAAVGDIQKDLPAAFELEVPLGVLVPHLNLTELKSICKVHGIKPSRGLKVFSLEEVQLFALIPESHHAVYALGAQLVRLDPVDEVPSGSGVTMLDDCFVCYDVPWMKLANKGTNANIVGLAKLHGLKFPVRSAKAQSLNLLSKHVCQSCPRYRAVFGPVLPPLRTSKGKSQPEPDLPKQVILDPPSDGPVRPYPPPPLTESEKMNIIKEFCDDLNPSCFEEDGCAVCGQLSLRTDLAPLDTLTCSLDPLIEPGLARQERFGAHEPITYASGPILDDSLTNVCGTCVEALSRGRRPHHALANGLWVGPVPRVLADLSYAEQVLVARVRTNRCVVRVSSVPGRPAHSKMMANAISFACPTVKIYHQLPPPKSEVDEVLAFIFTGHNPPEEDEIVRTPMLVRRNAVRKALEWLKLNHPDYVDLYIDYETLGTYPDAGSIVQVVVRPLEDGTNVVASATSVHDTFEDEGTTGGMCPFTVNGLIGSELDHMSLDARRAAATRHLRTGHSSVLAVGHAEKPESKYNNPQLYPQIYPWLFPYGAGGIGNARLHGLISDFNQKKWMLMYHDKRFQVETRFIIVGFNDEQITGGSTGSRIVAKRSNFQSIASRVHLVNPAVIKDIAARLQEGERVVPETDDEKLCFSIMDQIHQVGESVHGSMAGKKNMRSEVWSLIMYRGAPSWFITLSPADNCHPICIYWADKKVEFNPDLREYKERATLVAQNPVAGARFFRFMVLLLIKHLLRWNDAEGRSGVFGHTAAYYGTVEQQGRMTLHLHMLIWIVCALTPQQVRDRLMAKDSEFVKELIAYLEGAHTGDFFAGSLAGMKEKYGPSHRGKTSSGEHVAAPSSLSSEEPQPQVAAPRHVDPVQTLPLPPPVSSCSNTSGACRCEECDEVETWKEQFESTVDHLLYRSNVHSCFVKRTVQVNGSEKQLIVGKGCLNKERVCTAHFPRKVSKETHVDKDGHITPKKSEPNINTVNTIMTYCFRCNTDCSCILSGTAVKATAGYIADYICKMGLKTYQIFSSIYDVFERNPDVWAESKTDNDAARRLILKMANSLTSKIEIGGPMAAMYLLGHPDHYSSHTFVPLYWWTYVKFVHKVWEQAEEATCYEAPEVEEVKVASTFPVPAISDDSQEECEEPDANEGDTVVIQRSYGRILSRSNVDDYMMRPTELGAVCLYDWTQCSVRKHVAGLKKIPVSMLSYQDGHPLVKTHRVVYDVGRMRTTVPNFLGPYLPRPDGDDRELYCCTILTLYVPWRTPLDLKSSVDSWAEAFDRHTFTDRHAVLISNMNIRHECYDARDDYHAQLKLRSAAQHGKEDELETEDEEEEFPEDTMLENVDMELSEDHTLGVWSQKKQDQMKEVESVLISAGWVDSGGAPRADNGVGSFTPERMMGPSKWKAVVASARKSVLDSRLVKPPVQSVDQSYDPDCDDMPVFNAGYDRNDARILPGAYFLDDHGTLDADVESQMQGVISAYSLNEEQIRAFNIIAKHSISVNPEPLLMYIGGMGGTGKTRVIDSLRSWFDIRSEHNRMAVTAPTGAAASVVQGSTYHSYLGVATGDRRAYTQRGGKALDEARLRLKGVNYVFMDEISMVSCQDLHLIDLRLKDITRLDDLPFGGMSMIVAGDFAQLPPARGLSLYSGEVSKVQRPRQSQTDQENTLGMLLWNMFVTVVVLRQNMRQIAETDETEDAMRACLEHMRYKDCTEADLEFLRSRVPAYNPAINLSDPQWHNVSVITAWNTHKDQINEMNAARFARETGQQLHMFYSIDKQGRGTGQARQKLSSDQDNGKVKLTPAVQEALWRSPPHTSNHIAACLPLCIGMPVMIRNNDATELGITKGQEAVVKGWTSREIPGYPGRFALEVLFVQLVRAKTTVKLPYLDTNIVPLTKISTALRAVLPNDSGINISRQQIPVLLNFAMTDYASQGKTRKVNVIDLKRSRNHQAMYTALSRGTSAAATVILREFNEAKLTGGISGHLRQEFRTIDTLDEITKARYDKTMPSSVVQRLRASTILSYKAWQRMEDALDRNSATAVHALKRKRDNDPSDAIRPAKVTRYGIHTVDQVSLKRKREDDPSEAFRPAKVPRPVTVAVEQSPLKRRRESEDDDQDGLGVVKRSKFDHCPDPPVDESPRETDWMFSWVWDSDNWSCAYDSLFTVLRYAWSTSGSVFHAESSAQCSALQELLSVRSWLWELDSEAFPRGQTGADLYALARLVTGALPTDDGSALTHRLCFGCHARTPGAMYEGIGPYTVMRDELLRDETVSNYLSKLERVAGRCAECTGDLMVENEYPALLCLQLPNLPGTVLEKRLTIDTVVNLASCTYRLAGIVYWGGYHFTARVVSNKNAVYRYDGMENEGRLTDDFTLTTAKLRRALCTMDGKVASLAVYVRL
ncbi:hypothetical protein D9611_014437 [Ephemerocybe angulata]|uniref:ATP-dependent DNA helicase n=1 Tax=Ephemerocybe angulata TaxID=980116 RepID=A0A8H5ART9_9AGAR|nr:hypothetical protein D9611_014437 [Tulosesus angulatus]